MQHIHLKECNSTQLYIKENFKKLNANSQEVIVSTSFQKDGIGRHGNSWDDYPNAIALSFISKPNKDCITQIPLKIAITINNYIFKKWGINTLIKWPNDLFNQKKKKCGGILCQYHDSGSIICGVGLNIGKIEPQYLKKNYNTSAGPINKHIQFQPGEREAISLEIYQYISTNIDKIYNLQEDWQKNCFHINHNVILNDGKNEIKGVFKGISPDGRAEIIDSNGKTHVCISGSLAII